LAGRSGGFRRSAHCGPPLMRRGDRRPKGPCSSAWRPPRRTSAAAHCRRAGPSRPRRTRRQ
jgi:hypothetical protein